jgi:hypothetical protein
LPRQVLFGHCPATIHPRLFPAGRSHI